MAEKKNLSFSNIDVPTRDHILALASEAAERDGYAAANAWVEGELAGILERDLELKNTSSTTITSDVQAIWRHLDAIRTTLAAISGAFSTAEDEADARYRGTLVRQQEKLDAVEDERDELKKALSVSERRVQEMEAALAGAIEAHEAEVDALKARIEELEANSKGFDDVMAAIRQELGHKAEA